MVIAADGLQAELHVAKGAACTEAELRTALTGAGVSFGIDDAALHELAGQASAADWSGSAVIARGEAAGNGRDGFLAITDPPGLRPGTTHQDGTIDYRERHYLLPVAADTLVGTLMPPEPGRSGRTVAGKVLPAKAGAPLRLRPGPGVRLEGERLYAIRGGVLSLAPPLVDVVPLFVQGGDVDYRVGNLHTEGSVEVRGDVHEGFSVEATHDVHTAGAVLDATITAGARAIVDQGVLGDHARVTASGDLYCRHATAATLHGGGVVTFGDGASHCRALGDRIVAATGRGAVFGGELRARTSIVVRTAGTGQGARTLLAVGDVSDLEAAAVREALADQKLADRALQRGRQEGGRSVKAIRTAVRLGDPAQQAKLRIRMQQRERLRTAFVEVHETLHPGVRVQFGDKSFSTDSPRRHLRLRWDEEHDCIVEENLP